MRFKSVFTAAATALVIAVGGSSAASADVNLPTGNCGFAATNNCLVFDDFNVYSLAVLNYQTTGGNIKPGDPYDVSTNGNALRDALVVGTGVSGAVNNLDVIPSGAVDDAYNTPSDAGNGLSNFRTSSGTANTDAATSLIPGNTTGTWDIMVDDLVTYLDGGQLAFFFNLNQANSLTTYLNNKQDALGWMAVTLTDTQGSNGSITFWLDGNACDGPLADPTHCDPGQSYKGTQPPLSNANYANQNILPNDPDHDEWAYIHGQVCMSPQGAIVGFGACAQNDHTNTTVNQNLSANNAAFALYSELLQQALMSGDYDKMSVDFRMAALTNGYEQLLIFAATSIPEPLTIFMFGAGLLGLTGFAGLRRRKLKAA
jgi:hypothetical protein